MSAQRDVEGGARLLPRGALPRAIGFALLWLALSGGAPSALVPGAVAVIAATALSLHLLPSGDARPRPVAIVLLVLRFLRQSVVAGVDVAWRALQPSPRLQPGFVRCPAQLPEGSARDAFTALTSLLPGTVPTGPDEHGALLVHCLDVSQPVVAQLSKEEALLCEAMGWESRDG